MKKLMIAAAVACVAAFANAAAVGWSMAGCGDYKGDAYDFFIIGENGVTSIAQITALLDAGKDVSSYAFGSGTVADNGNATVMSGASGKSVTPASTQSYTGFFVLFDDATPKSGETQYVSISGATGLTKSVAPTAASTTFAAGNAATGGYLAAGNWKSFGPSTPTPEPTSGLLLVLGVAGLALKRRRA